MRDVLAAVPLVGLAPLLGLGCVAVLLLVIGVFRWRGHQAGGRVLVAGFVVFALGAFGLAVNTRFSYFDTLADLAGIASYDTIEGNEVPPDVAEPNGVVFSMRVPDTQSHFGSFDAKVWLPPQYFSDQRAHFPVVILTHGNPGNNRQWLGEGDAANTGLAVARSGHPVILVFPTVLQRPDGDSLCVDTPSQGNAETYIVQDVVAAADSQLRTISNAGGRAIGGFSMGGFCALNLGLKHPDVFSVVLDIAGETASAPDAIDGGNEELYGGADWQRKADANSPDRYLAALDPSRGPALWMDTGDSDEVAAKMQRFAAQLKAKGFTVEFRSRPGDHDFDTWTASLKQALPWVAQRLTR